jgi:hypothetical protein
LILNKSEKIIEFDPFSKELFIFFIECEGILCNHSKGIMILRTFLVIEAAFSRKGMMWLEV